ncbi:MAG: hypothetical protein CM1200mP38_1510 [Dehalococcoidia bacterium]|nr:MAG: hypothetical protein CM1200mP38_1510 [Dehalococcoidia bacterium]
MKIMQLLIKSVILLINKNIYPINTSSKTYDYEILRKLIES